MCSLSIRIQKDSLEAELAARQKDYKDVDRKYRRENNPAEKNNLQSQKDELLEEIDRIDKELKDLEVSNQNSSIEEVIRMIKPYYEPEKNQIKKAYRLSLPQRLINPELSLCLESLITDLQRPQQEEKYSCLEKFVGYLFFNQDITFKFKQDLKVWLEKNIEDVHHLLEQLSREQQQREQQYYPGLFVAIIEQEGGYIVEAWLNDNITESSSSYQQLKINQQAKIQTDETLTNIPELLKSLICKSIEKCQKDLKQIHIFLPAKLMNHAVDWWENWQEDEDEDYITTIGDDYEVLLRCSERLRGKTKSVFKWREKGSILKSKLAQSAEDIFILGESGDCKSLLKKIKLNEQAIAVKITTVFQEKEPGTLLWKAAVPLALWIRQQLPQINNQTVLDELLRNSQCLQDLPKQVKFKRVEAFDQDPPENHIGRHLCLLWDDPNIVPPEQILTEKKL